MTAIQKAFVASVLIHALVLWSTPPINRPPKNITEAEQQKKTTNDKKMLSDDKKYIQDKPFEATFVKVLPKKASDQLAYETFQKKVAECKQWFGGVGLTLNALGPGLIVLNAHKFYPAATSGIVPGDIILTPVSEMKGEVGSDVNVEVIRDGKLLTFTMKRGKICIDESKEPAAAIIPD